MKTIGIYCGSSTGDLPIYPAAAEAMGQALVEAGLSLVYGGGNTGMMGVLGNAVLAAGGHVTGIMTQRLVDREKVHRGLSELEVVETMHERKSRIAARADAFIAMPGGIGTLEELFEVFTWSQLNIHDKPCGLLNPGGFFDELIVFADKLVTRGFMKPYHRGILMDSADPKELLKKLQAFQFDPTVIK